MQRPTHFPSLVRSLANRGFTQRAIARQLHVAPSTVCRWLTAEREPRGHNAVGLIFFEAEIAQRQHPHR